jgi:hypothetical protein
MEGLLASPRLKHFLMSLPHRTRWTPRAVLIILGLVWLSVFSLTVIASFYDVRILRSNIHVRGSPYLVLSPATLDFNLNATRGEVLNFTLTNTGTAAVSHLQYNESSGLPASSSLILFAWNYQCDNFPITNPALYGPNTCGLPPYAPVGVTWLYGLNVTLGNMVVQGDYSFNVTITAS